MCAVAGIINGLRADHARKRRRIGASWQRYRLRSVSKHCLMTEERTTQIAIYGGDGPSDRNRKLWPNRGLDGARSHICNCAVEMWCKCLDLH